MKTSIPYLLLSTIFLTGCVSAYADSQCQSAGYQKGTPAYNSCFNQVSQEQRRCLMVLSQAQFSGTNGALALAQAGCSLN